MMTILTTEYDRPVAGVKCLSSPLLEKGAFGLHSRKGQSMSLVHAIKKELSLTAKLLGVAQPSLENKVPLYLSISHLIAEQPKHLVDLTYKLIQLVNLWYCHNRSTVDIHQVGGVLAFAGAH